LNYNNENNNNVINVKSSDETGSIKKEELKIFESLKDFYITK
jgi:hypothetical protein